jgi:hypothetical protein
MSGLTIATPARPRALPAELTRKLALSLVFGTVLVAQLARHAMWRDELNAWAIALASPTLPDLFHNLHYDGHPGLWHLLLWLASWVSVDPVMLKLVHGAIGLALIGFIIWRGPFTAVETLLLLLSYFVLFEYTVISRNYGIAMLLALIHAQRRATHPEQLGRNAALLGLLANTNVFALLLSGAFAAEYALERLAARDRRRGAWLSAAALYGGLLLLAAATMAPPPDMSWRTAGQAFDRPFSWEFALNQVGWHLSALLPLQPASFWAMHPQTEAVWRGRRWVVLLIAALSPALAIALRRTFLPCPRLLLIPGLTLVASVGFTVFIYTGEIRHWGVHFVAIIAALWILRREQPPVAPPGQPLVLGLLAVNALAGGYFAAAQWCQPFSRAQDVAAWLRAAHLRDAALLGTPDTVVAPVAILLGRTMTFLDCDCTDSYARFLRRREDFRPDQVPARLARDAAAAGPGPVLFVTNTALTEAQLAELAAAGDRAIELARFDGAVTDEDYVLYRIERGK